MKIFNKDIIINIKRLLPYLSKYKGKVILAGIATAFSIILQLPLPLLTMHIIDKLIYPEKAHLVGLICMGLIVVVILRVLSSFLERYFLTVFRLRAVTDLKCRLYEHILRLSLDYFHKKQTGYIISRVSGDVEGIQGLFAETFLLLLRNLLTFAAGAVMVYWLNVKLALIATAILPFYVISLFAFNKKIRELVAENREAYANVYKYLQEHLSGISVIKAFIAEKHDTISMLKSLKTAIKKEFRSSMIGTIAALAAGFISSLGPILILWIGILEIINGRLTLGGLIAFNAFMGYLFSPLGSISNINVTIQNSLACAKRVFEILDLHPETPLRKVTPTSCPSLNKGSIEFRNVSFVYAQSHNGEAVLNDISLTVPAGKITAIVGRSGVGKSSIVNLLFRFYDHQDGDIFIDGHDIRDFDLKYLRGNIGLVTQETFLFGYSILENIKLARPRASDDEAVEAAKAAYAHDFIMNLPEKYETKIGERGALISGGERQRIALARVFLKDPRILILDEATSSLDSQSESYVKKAMMGLFENRTVIIISHRLSTISDADNIVVLDAGRVVATGSHHSLYENNSLYRDLYDEQFSGAGTSARLL
ncbi:MAG: ABC transporter ATP-binding protein [Candidatus Zixiibacteriota bacterium]